MTSLSYLICDLLGFLGPYRVNIRQPLNDEEFVSITWGAFTFNQALTLLNTSKGGGSVTRFGALVALKS